MKMNHKRASKTSSQSQPSPCLWAKASEASHLSNLPAGATFDGVVVGGMVGSGNEIRQEPERSGDSLSEGQPEGRSSGKSAAAKRVLQSEPPVWQPTREPGPWQKSELLIVALICGRR